MNYIIRALGAAALLLCLDVRQAYAVAITLGNRIDLTPSTFALPIQITDAVAVSEWFLDLTYDPTDVQINLGCDPFGGDSFCSLLTGPVTEGDFFGAGAPFNLLVPGFVELDPTTFTQAGRLFGMHGAFGGTAPAPSGNGVLAYVEFTLLGTGDSPIDLGDTAVSEPVSVPEPGTLALLAGTLVLVGGRWLSNRRGGRRMNPLSRIAACIALASLSIGGTATAQLPPAIELPPGLPTLMPAPPAGYPPTVAPTAAAPYFAPPAWSQTLAPNVRFVILSNFNSDAVLDRETGLVWTRKTVAEVIAPDAIRTCKSLVVGNRMGWRLPTVAELQSLIDTSPTVSNPEPRLPVGHPFVLAQLGFSFGHFALETRIINTDVELRSFVYLASGASGFLLSASPAEFGVLCVRGMTLKTEG